jgi:DNA-3-methyladenine glycosylase I
MPSDRVVALKTTKKDGTATAKMSRGGVRVSPDRSEIGRLDVLRRCSWAEGDPLLLAYHDEEWGVPERDSRQLWETMMLEGFQAGLSWTIILRKRDAFRKAFEGFDPGAVARFGEEDVARLLQDPAIVRSRAKIEATISGARVYLAMQAAGEDFSTFVWDIAGGRPIQNTGPVPAKTPLSEEFSKALKKRGFKFVGPVIVYAWMQATGIVNDHALSCFRRGVVERMAET